MRPAQVLLHLQETNFRYKRRAPADQIYSQPFDTSTLEQPFQTNSADYSASERWGASDPPDSVYHFTSGPGMESAHDFGTNTLQNYNVELFDSALEQGTAGPLINFSFVDATTANQWKACVSQDQCDRLEPGPNSENVTLLGENLFWQSDFEYCQAEDDLNSMLLTSISSTGNKAIATTKSSNDLTEKAAGSKRRSGPLPPSRHQAKKPRNIVSCIRCWVSKTKCEDLGDLCMNCSESKISPQICVRERFANAAVFKKCTYFA